jgi:hypothetical protein
MIEINDKSNDEATIEHFKKVRENYNITLPFLCYTHYNIT